MDSQVYLSSITPQVRGMFYAGFDNMTADIIHEKVSYTYRFFIITEGSCTVRLDSREQLCKKGDMVFLCPYQNYSTIFHPSDFQCINIVFEFVGDPGKPPCMNEPIQKILCYSHVQPKPDSYSQKLNFVDMPVFNTSFFVSGMPGAESRIVKMHETFIDRNKLPRLRLNAMLLELIADIAEYKCDDHLRVHSDIAQRILLYIDEHYSENLTCGLISEKFSYHTTYINRIIRSYTGYSLHNYITRVKVQNATRMLLGGELSITDIAYRLSFCDSSHFSKVYQEYTGFKPSDVRRRQESIR